MLQNLIFYERVNSLDKGVHNTRKAKRDRIKGIPAKYLKSTYNDKQLFYGKEFPQNSPVTKNKSKN